VVCEFRVGDEVDLVRAERLGCVENVLDHGRKPPAFLDDESVVFVLFGHILNPSALQALCHQPHRCNRSAQLMRNTRNEVALHLGQAQLAREGTPGSGKSEQRRGSRNRDQQTKQRAPLPLAGKEHLRIDEMDVAAHVFDAVLDFSGRCENGGRGICRGVVRPPSPASQPEISLPHRYWRGGLTVALRYGCRSMLPMLPSR
jgi:hypothetical protein